MGRQKFELIRESTSSLPKVSNEPSEASPNDIKDLFNIVSGRDSIWRFLPLAQLHEIRGNLASKFKHLTQPPDQLNLPQLRSLLKRTYTPNFAGELAAVASAKELSLAWNNPTNVTFEGAPICLRLMLSFKYEAPGLKHEEIPRYCREKHLNEVLDHCVNKHWIIASKPGGPRFSAAAQKRVADILVSPFLRPTGTEALFVPLRVKQGDWVGLARSLIREAEKDLALFYTARYPQRKRAAGDAGLGHLIGDLKVRGCKLRAPASKMTLDGVRKVLRGLDSAEASRETVRLFKSIARACLPKDAGESPPALQNLLAWSNDIKALTCFHNLLLPEFRGCLTTKNCFHRLLPIQRQLLSIISAWLSNSHVDVSVKKVCAELLIQATKPIGQGTTAQVALREVYKGRALFSKEQIAEIGRHYWGILDEPGIRYDFFVSHYVDTSSSSLKGLGILQFAAKMKDQNNCPDDFASRAQDLGWRYVQGRRDAQERGDLKKQVKAIERILKALIKT